MRRITFCLAIISLSACLGSAEGRSFYEALDVLVKDCPEIKIVQANNEAVISLQKSMNRISSPEIEMEQVWGHDNVGNKFDIGISQSFDWPTVYKARAKAINAQTAANVLLEQATLLDKTLEVKGLMIDIIFQKKNIELIQLIHNHSSDLEKAARESFHNGEISKLEFKRTELERIQTSIELRENQRLLDELYSQLESATGRPDCIEIMSEVKEPPTWTIKEEEDYEAKINTYDPRMAYLNASIDAMKAIGNSEKKAASLPSFSLGYAFQREQGETFNGFNISMSLPVYGISNLQRASRANILSAELEAQSEKISILTNMRNMRRAAVSLAQELNDYSVIFSNGNYAELLKIALEGGETDNIHYFQELNYYTEVTKQYLELQHQYNLALVSLNRYDFITD